MWTRIKILTSDVWQYLQPVLVLFITTAGKQLLILALRAVQEAENQEGLSSSEKRDFAYSAIKDGVATAQDRFINLAIEIAVNKLKP